MPSIQTLWMLMKFVCFECGYNLPLDLPEVSVVPDLHAHGTHKTGVIQLMQYDDKSGFDRSILLHEIVHYVQYFNGVSEPREDQLDYKEIEALRLQDMYLRGRGLLLQDFTSVSAMKKMTKDSNFTWENWK